MAAITSALIAIAGVVLGWIAIEIACKPCLERGREAIDRSLNPDYDPDDEENNAAARAPLISNPDDIDAKAGDSSSALTTAVKGVWIPHNVFGLLSSGHIVVASDLPPFSLCLPMLASVLPLDQISSPLSPDSSLLFWTTC